MQQNDVLIRRRFNHEDNTLLPQSFDAGLAYDLVTLCNASYNELFSTMTRTRWQPPEGFELAVTLHEPYERGGPTIGFIATREDTIYVTWRGTILPVEWQEDAKTGQVVCSFLDDGSHVEAGFHELYTADRPNHPSPRSVVLDYLRAHRTKKVVVTGHSLGASLAELNGVDIAVTLERDVTVVSFAAPRTGDPQFAATYGRAVPSSFRVFNTFDPVPGSVPILVPGFQPTYYTHVPQAVPITFGVPWGGFANHAISGYVSAMKRLADTQSSDSKNVVAAGG